jgi:hypothetical protein
MLAANFDITLDRATDYSFVLTINNQSGGAVDLASPIAFYADIREIASKKEAQQFTCNVTGATTNGQVTLSLTEVQTKALKAGSGIYEWDLFMIRSTITTRLLYGSVTVRPQITNNV